MTDHMIGANTCTSDPTRHHLAHLSSKTVLQPHTYGPALVVAIGGPDGFTNPCDYANTSVPRGTFRNNTRHQQLIILVGVKKSS